MGITGLPYVFNGLDFQGSRHNSYQPAARAGVGTFRPSLALRAGFVRRRTPDLQRNPKLCGGRFLLIVIMLEEKMTPTIVVFEDHWIVGMVPSTGLRLLDILKDKTTDYLRMKDAQLFREEDRDHSIASVPEVVISKDRIGLVVLPSREHETPTKRRNSRVEKRASQAVFVVSRYSVQGEFHMSGLRDDSLYMMVSEMGDFFPVTNATIACPSGNSVAAPVVIANKAMVNCFCLCKSPPRQPHPELAATTEI